MDGAALNDGFDPALHGAGNAAASPFVERARPAPPLKVGVLVDLALTPDAGGHVKCWERIAEAAIDFPDRLDLTVHFNNPDRSHRAPAHRVVAFGAVCADATGVQHQAPRAPSAGPYRPWPAAARARPDIIDV